MPYVAVKPVPRIKGGGAIVDSSFNSAANVGGKMEVLRGQDAHQRALATIAGRVLPREIPWAYRADTQGPNHADRDATHAANRVVHSPEQPARQPARQARACSAGGGARKPRGGGSGGGRPRTAGSGASGGSGASSRRSGGRQRGSALHVRDADEDEEDQEEKRLRESGGLRHRPSDAARPPQRSDGITRRGGRKLKPSRTSGGGGGGGGWRARKSGSGGGKSGRPAGVARQSRETLSFEQRQQERQHKELLEQERAHAAEEELMREGARARQQQQGSGRKKERSPAKAAAQGQGRAQQQGMRPGARFDADAIGIGARSGGAAGASEARRSMTPAGAAIYGGFVELLGAFDRAAMLDLAEDALKDAHEAHLLNNFADGERA